MDRPRLQLVTTTGLPKTCWTCQNASFSDHGTYCLVFTEFIDNEVMAGSDCLAYDRNLEAH